MSNNQANLIPVAEPVVDDQGKMTLIWIQFLQSITNGDTGTSFTPDVEGLTVNGVPTITGVYYNNAGFIDFFVRIVPGIDTTSVAGTTYIQLPFTVTSDTACLASTGTTGSAGGISANTNRAYPPAWTALTGPVTISGRVPVQ